MTKRILIVTGIYPPDIGGSASYSHLLKEELPERGFEVSVLTYAGGNPEISGLFFVSNGWPKGIRHVIYLLKILALGRKRDLILAADSSFGAAFVGALAAKLLGKKYIVRVTGDYAWEQGVQRFGVNDLLDDFQDKKYGLFVEFLRKCQRFSVSSADVVISPSKYLKKIASGWGIDANKIQVIYNSSELPDGKMTKQEARERLGLGGNILLSAGRLVPWKGFGLLIEILPRLLGEYPDLRLVIIGDGPERAALELKAKNLKLEANVSFTGKLPKAELLQYLAAADVFALNTAYEGFSHQIIEAMSFGLPVITTRVGGNPEIVRDGESGFLGSYNDPVFFRDSIRKILADAGSRSKLGEGARAAADRFSKERMLKELSELLNSL